jgi:hypothetical protein
MNNKIEKNYDLDVKDYKDLFMLVLNLQEVMKKKHGRRKVKKNDDYIKLDRLKEKLGAELAKKAEHSGVFIEETV